MTNETRIALQRIFAPSDDEGKAYVECVARFAHRLPAIVLEATRDMEPQVFEDVVKNHAEATRYVALLIGLEA